MKKQLPNVTLLAVCGNKHTETIASLYKSLEQISPERTLLLTNMDIDATGIDVVNVGGLESWEAYNYFLIKEIYKYIETDFFIVTQWDAWVLDAEQWDDRYYDYSYIGASWLDRGTKWNVGNGGGSWRSLKLHQILGNDNFIEITAPEDNAICKLYRTYLEEKYNIKFAPEEIADKFSFELNVPIQKTFMFHGWHHEPYKETIVIKRTFALGDVLGVEPLLHYFHKKGYRVALDTDEYFMQFFLGHYFPVLDAKRLNPDLKVRTIDLDMSYERNPKQLHLESYYDAAEVPKEERLMNRPILGLGFNPKENRLFDKYVLIHIDERAENHRNIYGVVWSKAVTYLREKGYSVIQLGNNKHEIIRNAIHMNTPTAPFLKWVIGGADMFVGIDSGISHVAVAFGVPCVILSGSVDLRLIHPDMTGIQWVTNHHKNICNLPYCWHNTATQSAPKCYVSDSRPPCSVFTEEQIINAIDKAIK